jgi:hypothetical protein
MHSYCNTKAAVTKRRKKCEKAESKGRADENEKGTHDVPYRPKKESPDKRLVRTFRKVKETSNRYNMYQRDVDTHWPVNISFLVMIGDKAWDISPHFH